MPFHIPFKEMLQTYRLYSFSSEMIMLLLNSVSMNGSSEKTVIVRLVLGKTVGG